MTRGPAPVLAGATAIQADLSDPETLVPLVRGADALIHCHRGADKLAWPRSAAFFS